MANSTVLALLLLCCAAVPVSMTLAPGESTFPFIVNPFMPSFGVGPFGVGGNRDAIS